MKSNFFVLSFCFLAFGCSESVNHFAWPPPTPAPGACRVLFIGVDAADWDDIDPLIAQGKLPNWAALKSRGAYGNQTSVSSDSPSIWTSIATGVLPEQHGILTFTFPNPKYDANDPKSQKYLPGSSGMRKCKALWNYLSAADRTVGIVGWYVTWPAEPVNGYMVSSYAAVDINSGGEQLTGKGSFYADGKDILYPPDLSVGSMGAKIRALTNKAVTQSLQTNEKVFRDYPHKEESGRYIDETRWVFAADEIFFQIGVQMLQDYPTDFFAIYLAGADVIGHRFTGSLENKAVLNRYYERIDEMIGALVAQVPKDSLIVLASDHGTSGMSNEAPAHDLEGGIYLYAGPCTQPGHYTAKSDSLDFLPNLLAVQDVPIPVSLPKRPMDFLFKDEWVSSHPLKLAKTDLGRETCAAPDRPKYDEEIQKRLYDIGYVGKNGESVTVKATPIPGKDAGVQ